MLILNQCRQEAYAAAAEGLAEIDEGLAMHDITKKEAEKLKGEIDTTNCYEKYQSLLIMRLGFLPEKMTKLEYERRFG